MSILYFPICAFLCIVLIMIVFFSKKRANNEETRLFNILLILNFIIALIEFGGIFLYILKIPDEFTIFLNRIYLPGYLLWIWVFTLYIFYVSYNGKNYKKFIIISGVFNFFIILALLFLPVHIYSELDIMYTYGPAHNILYSICVLYVVANIIFMASGIKGINHKKYYPLYIFILLAVIALIVRYINPGILLITAVLTYIDMIMFHTIENPDMKLINELNIAKEQAERANTAKSDFLSSMSHEIRTPLNAVVGFSQTLLEEQLSESQKEDVNNIIMASNNLLEIVNGVLDISKIEANKLEIIDSEYNAKKIFDEIITLANGRLGDKPLDFRINIDPNLPKVLYGDHSRLKQICVNLLTNAIKYTKDGYFDFTVNSVIKDDVCRLIISVEDSGIGIKKEKIEKLFEKFDRGEAERNTSIEGTGLGLAITQKLVELMNGKIVVQSEYGTGSKFTVAIDQRIIDVSESTLENTISIKLDEILNLHDKKVLIVDDNRINLKVASKLLKNYNVEIEEVISGKECIEKIEAGYKYDLILLDDMMPVMSGVETFKILKDNPNFNIPTVALTANAISGMKEKYLADGFDDYLSKPIDKNELNRVINKFLNK